MIQIFPLPALLDDQHLFAGCHTPLLGLFSSFSALLAHLRLLFSSLRSCVALSFFFRCCSRWILYFDFAEDTEARSSLVRGIFTQPQRHWHCHRSTSEPPLTLQGCCRFQTPCWQRILSLPWLVHGREVECSDRTLTAQGRTFWVLSYTSTHCCSGWKEWKRSSLTSAVKELSNCWTITSPTTGGIK